MQYFIRKQANQVKELLLKWICLLVYRFLLVFEYSVTEATFPHTWEYLMRHWFGKTKFIYGISVVQRRHDTVFLRLRHQPMFHNDFLMMSISATTSLGWWLVQFRSKTRGQRSTFSCSWWFSSMIPFQPLLYSFHVVAHRSWPTFVNNPSVLNDVKADGKSTVSDVCCVKHCVYYHWTSGNFSRHLTRCTTSFGLCSVRSDFVVVLWKEVKSNLIKALKRIVVSNTQGEKNHFKGITPDSILVHHKNYGFHPNFIKVHNKITYF